MAFIIITTLTVPNCVITTTRFQRINIMFCFMFKGRSTNIAAGIRLMYTEHFSSDHGERPGVTKVGLLITDGHSDNNEEAIDEALEAKKRNIKMHAVGISPAVRTI